MPASDARREEARPPTIEDLVELCKQLKQEVEIIVADLDTMIKTKRGIRPKDREDLAFLRQLKEGER